jgi:hypothetical protein
MTHHDSQSCFSQRLNQRISTSATADFFNKIGQERPFALRKNSDRFSSC